MNKAFVREPEPDGRAFCPACGAEGLAVTSVTLQHHLLDSSTTLGSDVWFCPTPNCECAYFDLLERMAFTSELKEPVYPKSSDAPICACFGFTLDELDDAVQNRSPESIRQLLAKSKSKEANCGLLSASGRCCMPEVQRIYIRGIQSQPDT